MIFSSVRFKHRLKNLYLISGWDTFFNFQRTYIRERCKGARCASCDCTVFILEMYYITLQEISTMWQAQIDALVHPPTAEKENRSK